MFKRFCAALTIVAVIGSAGPAFGVSCNKLKECIDSEGDIETGFSFGYVKAISECTNINIPEEVKFKQVFEIVKVYINSHPEKWHETATSSIYSSITEAFPEINNYKQ